MCRLWFNLIIQSVTIINANNHVHCNHFAFFCLIKLFWLQLFNKSYHLSCPSNSLLYKTQRFQQVDNFKNVEKKRLLWVISTDQTSYVGKV